LTGWKQDDALGRDLKEVFNIVNQETRVSVQSPVTEALENGVIVYLPDQIKLISKHGIEILLMTALHLSKLTTERLLALFSSSEILPTVNRRSHLSYCWSNPSSYKRKLKNSKA